MDNASPNAAPYAIVVAVDFGPPCEEAVKEALKIAAERAGSEVHIVHVIDSSEGGPRTVRIRSQAVALEHLPARMREYVAAQAKDLGRPGNAHLGIHVRIGKPVDAILQMAVDVQADLLIVGTHGREGFRRMVLGSVTEELVRTAHCPVLVARSVDYQGLHATERITPPCPDCVTLRKTTRGTQWWCDRHHSTPQRKTHVYSGMAPVHWVAGSVDLYGAGTAVTQL